MKITKVMLESMVRQELKKVLKEAEIPPHVRSRYDSGKLYLNTDLAPLYAGLVQDVASSLNIDDLSGSVNGKRYAAAMKNEILKQIALHVKEAKLPPSDILNEAGEYVAEFMYPKVMTSQEQIYDTILGRMNDITEKYDELERGFEKEEMEYDDEEDDYHDELGPDATEDDFY